MQSSTHLTLLFLCSSLAEGIDGVGDYTRRLAQACVAKGCACVLVALNDPHLSAATDEIDGAGIRIVRFPAQMPWPERHRRLHALNTDASPDYVSWQFVSYGYNPKGIIPSNALLAICRIFATRQRHAFLHELWIGLSQGESYKNILIGNLQKHRILKWLKSWAPITLNTSNPVYQQVLKLKGYHAEVLPLFGNVPIIKATKAAAPDTLVVTTFGTLHPQWDPEATALFLRDAAHALGLQLRLRIAGRAGAHLSRVQTAFIMVNSKVDLLGPLSAEQASLAIQESQLGIAPHPWALIGKSGAALALIEHGIPVLVPRDDWLLRSGETPSPLPEPLLMRLRKFTPSALPAFLSRRTMPEARIENITNLFINKIQNRRTPNTPRH